MIYWIIFGAFVVGMLVYGYLSNFFLTKSKIKVSCSKKQNDLKRIVLLSDLHGNTFGKNNSKLVEKIKEEKPDAILIAGDMTVKNGKGCEIAIDLCKRLVELSTVYYGLGNHEIRMPNESDFREELKQTGVIFLDNETSEFSDKIFISALTLPVSDYKKVWEKKTFSTESMNQMLSYQKKNQYQILIAHNPEYFKEYAEWGADLVLSGHVHGGIAGLPFRGVLAPSLRIFPKYSRGMYEEYGSKMIVSRGLGLHHIKLRFFNLPEIVVIDMI